jgi:hypothetical protein
MLNDMLNERGQPLRGAADSASTTGIVSLVRSSLASGVHPAFAHAPVRRCARPDCSATAAVTLVCHYTARTVLMMAAAAAPEVDDPARYDLCTRHADRFRPPHGWELTVDVRTTHEVGLDDVDPRELAAALG